MFGSYANISDVFVAQALCYVWYVQEEVLRCVVLDAWAAGSVAHCLNVRGAK